MKNRLVPASVIFIAAVVTIGFSCNKAFADVQQARGQTSQALQQVSQLEQRLAQLQAWCNTNCSNLTPDSQQRLQSYIQTLQQGAAATRNDLQEVIAMQDQCMQGNTMNWEARMQSVQAQMANRLISPVALGPVCDAAGNCASGNGSVSQGSPSIGSALPGSSSVGSGSQPKGSSGSAGGSSCSSPYAFCPGNTFPGGGSIAGAIGGLAGAFGSLGGLLGSLGGLLGGIH